MNNLRGRTARDSGHGWGSRDYDSNVKCEATHCPVNDQRGRCSMASAIEIGPDLKCRTGAEFIELKAKLPPRPERPLDGD